MLCAAHSLGELPPSPAFSEATGGQRGSAVPGIPHSALWHGGTRAIDEYCIHKGIGLQPIFSSLPEGQPQLRRTFQQRDQTNLRRILISENNIVMESIHGRMRLAPFSTQLTGCSRHE